MSKLLRKLLSAAIFPAALLIVSKLLGIYLANRIFGLGWSIDNQSQRLFSVQVVYPDLDSAIKANSYSNFVMVVAMLIGTGALIFQGYFLHSSHQNPKVLIKLMRFNFIAWLTENSILFPKLSVWLSFLWISSLITIVQTIQNESYMWVAVSAFVSTLILTALAVHDIEKEIKTVLPENGKLNVG